MVDGKTPLAGSYFNPILQDLDLRVADLEGLRLAWDAVVQLVTDQGLVRINEVLAPAFDALDQELTDATAKTAEIESKRQAAIAAIQGMQAALDSYEAATEASIGEWKATIQAALTTWQAALAGHLQPAESATYTYETPAGGAPRIKSASEVIFGQIRSTVVSYNADGTVAALAVTYGGKTRTETYQYTSGLLSGVTTTES